MSTTETELSVVYPDNFSEEFTVSELDLKRILEEAKDDDQLDFKIGDKTFNKADIALIATSNMSIQFN